MEILRWVRPGKTRLNESRCFKSRVSILIKNGIAAAPSQTTAEPTQALIAQQTLQQLC